MQTDGAQKHLLHVSYVPVRETKQSRAVGVAQQPVNWDFISDEESREGGFCVAEGVGESGNEPPGTPEEKHISSEVERRGAKRGVRWTVDGTTRAQHPPGDDRRMGIRFQGKEATLLPQKTLKGKINISG